MEYIVISTNVLEVVPPRNLMTCKNNQPGTHMQHIFSQIFGKESTQEDVFIKLIPELLPDFIAGRDMLLCSYGVRISVTSLLFVGLDKGGYVNKFLHVINCI